MTYPDKNEAADTAKTSELLPARGGKITIGSGLQKFFEVDGGDGAIGFLGRNFVLFFAVLFALFTTLFAPIARFPANEKIAAAGIVFAFLLTSNGFVKSGSDRIYAALMSRLKILGGRLIPVVILLTSFICGALLTPLGAAVMIIPVVALLYRSWYKNSLITALTVSSCTLGGFLSPLYSIRFVLDKADMTYLEYVKLILPFAIIGLAICVIAAFAVGAPVTAYTPKETEIKIEPVTLGLYTLLLILCVLCVLGVLDIIVGFVGAVLVSVILDSDNFRRVDYGLLFIIFLLSIASWNIIRADMLTLPSDPFFASVFVTEIIDVPEAISFLFPKNVPTEKLLQGVNIGSLGLITASTANLYAYRTYIQSPRSKPIIGGLIFFGIGITLVLIFSAFAVL
jgi:hypothetical protein